MVLKNGLAKSVHLDERSIKFDIKAFAELKARVHLGFQAVQIFGAVNIKTSIKQIVSYVQCFVDKSLTDASLIGLRISLANFNDALMKPHINETSHNRCYSLAGDPGQYRKMLTRSRLSNSNSKTKHSN